MNDPAHIPGADDHDAKDGIFKCEANGRVMFQHWCTGGCENAGSGNDDHCT